MILLDAYALVAWLAGEPAAPHVKALLREGDTAVTSVNLAEAVDISTRVCEIDAHEVRAALSLVTGTRLRVVPSDESHAWAAGALRAEHYHRRTQAISIPDCLLVAAAGESDRIATADPGVLSVARSEGIGVIALPDSSGRVAP